MARRQTFHDVVRVRVEEERDRIARCCARIICEVPRAEKAVVGPLPQQLARVHDEGVFDHGNLDPALARFVEDREAWTVLQQQCEERRIDVWGNTERAVGPRRVWRIVRHAQPPERGLERIVEPSRLNIESGRIDRNEAQRDRFDFGGELGDDRLEARRVGFVEPLVVVECDLGVALQQKRLVEVAELTSGQLAFTDRQVADTADRPIRPIHLNRALDVLGDRVERTNRFEEAVYEGALDAVSDELIEAHRLRCSPKGACGFLKRARVFGRQPRCDVDRWYVVVVRRNR